MIPGGARAPRNIEPFMCKNLLIDNLTIKNPGDWNVCVRRDPNPNHTPNPNHNFNHSHDPNPNHTLFIMEYTPFDIVSLRLRASFECKLTWSAVPTPSCMYNAGTHLRVMASSFGTRPFTRQSRVGILTVSERQLYLPPTSGLFR